MLGQLLRLSRVARLSWGLATLEYDHLVSKILTSVLGAFSRFRVSVFSSCPVKSCEVNLPELSGVARNGPSRAMSDHSKIKLTL